MRFPMMLACNVVAPGTGLIVLRREWLGFALATLYCLLAQIAILGALLIPYTIPRPVTGLSALGAVAVWGWSQWLFYARFRRSAGEAVERELRLLSERAAEAMAAGDCARARDCLQAALTINDEHLASNKQWARLLTLSGRYQEASRAWRRVSQLEPDAEERQAARRALRDLARRYGRGC